MSTISPVSTNALSAYINAVDQNGGVNRQKIQAAGSSTADQRAAIVEGYAAEFVAGDRLEDVNMMSQYVNQLVADLGGASGQNAQNAATFAFVASRYKNSGANYDNGKLKQILQKSGNQDLIKNGVGTKDVQTLGAVYQALKRGTLSLDQVFNNTSSDAVKDDAVYNKAIEAVKAGDLGSSIKGGGNAAGGAGNAAGGAGNSAGGAGNAAGGAGKAHGGAGAGGAGNAAGGAGNAAGGAGNAAGGAVNAGQAGGNSNIQSILQQLIQLLTSLMQSLGGSAPNGGAGPFGGSLEKAGGAGNAAGGAGNSAGGAGNSAGGAGNSAGGAGNSAGGAGNSAGGAGNSAGAAKKPAAAGGGGGY